MGYFTCSALPLVLGEGQGCGIKGILHKGIPLYINKSLGNPFCGITVSQKWSFPTALVKDLSAVGS